MRIWYSSQKIFKPQEESTRPALVMKAIEINECHTIEVLQPPNILHPLAFEINVNIPRSEILICCSRKNKVS